jgi:hypothetical protein
VTAKRAGGEAASQSLLLRRVHWTSRNLVLVSTRTKTMTLTRLRFTEPPLTGRSSRVFRVWFSRRANDDRTTTEHEVSAALRAMGPGVESAKRSGSPDVA